MPLVDLMQRPYPGKSLTNTFKGKWPEEDCFDLYYHRYDEKTTDIDI